MSKRDRIWYFLICVFLAGIVAGIYWPVRNHQFVMYDDNLYVTENKHVTTGLNLENVKWAFTKEYASNWHPLTWISHMVDCEIYGTSPGGHHFTNLIFHSANTVLLFVILQYLTGTLWASVFIAAVFGLHPLHVESVAWVAERKDVLSTFFMLITLWAYTKYVRGQNKYFYAASLVGLSLGLMAKPMLVTLPFVFLLLDYWPLERLQTGSENGSVTAGITKRKFPYLLKEKIPFFILAAISSLITFHVQNTSGAVIPFEYINFKYRLANSVVSYVSYMGKMFWPVNLAVFYPHEGNGLSIPLAILCALILIVLTIYFYFEGLRRRYLLVGWLWFLGTLVPVIGLVQVGSQAMADRYMYIPMIGLLIITAWGGWELSQRIGIGKIGVCIIASAAIFTSTILTMRQISYWQTSKILFEHAIKISPRAYDLQNNYANLLKEEGKNDEAIKNFKVVLANKPALAETYFNLGNTYAKIKRPFDAIENYKQAIKFKPDFILAYNSLGTTLARTGRFDEAVAVFKKGLELKPDDLEILNSAGQAYADKKDFEKASQYYRRAIEAEPADVIGHGRLALVLASMGKLQESLEQCEFVLSKRPDDIEMHCNAGMLLEKLGKPDEAQKHYQQALKINSKDQKATQLLKNLEQAKNK